MHLHASKESVSASVCVFYRMILIIKVLKDVTEIYKKNKIYYSVNNKGCLLIDSLDKDMQKYLSEKNGPYEK